MPLTEDETLLGSLGPQFQRTALASLNAGLNSQRQGAVRGAQDAAVRSGGAVGGGTLAGIEKGINQQTADLAYKGSAQIGLEAARSGVQVSEANRNRNFQSGEAALNRAARLNEFTLNRQDRIHGLATSERLGRESSMYDMIGAGLSTVGTVAGYVF